jgi:hypothetical protein
MSTFAQQMSVAVYLLLTKETKLPFAENERKSAVFLFAANKLKLPFSVSFVFRIFKYIYIYVLKRQHINMALILAILRKCCPQSLSVCLLALPQANPY